MNGRVYDPQLGRFASVDPVFQFPTNTQSLNPYTYVLNSPLTLTDPTGLAEKQTEAAPLPASGAAPVEAAAKSSDGTTTGTVKPSGVAGVLHMESVSGVQLENGSSTGVGDKEGTTKKPTSAEPETIEAPSTRKFESTPRVSDEEDHFGVFSRPHVPLASGGTDNAAGAKATQDQVDALTQLNYSDFHGPVGERETKAWLDDKGRMLGRTQAGCSGDDRCKVLPRPNGGTLLVHSHAKAKTIRSGTSTPRDGISEISRLIPGPGDARTLKAGIPSGVIMPDNSKYLFEGTSNAPTIRYLGGGNAALGQYVEQHWKAGATDETIRAMASDYWDQQRGVSR